MIVNPIGIIFLRNDHAATPKTMNFTCRYAVFLKNEPEKSLHSTKSIQNKADAMAFQQK
jgi:hypothetical protein